MCYVMYKTGCFVQPNNRIINKKTRQILFSTFISTTDQSIQC